MIPAPYKEITHALLDDIIRQIVVVAVALIKMWTRSSERRKIASILSAQAMGVSPGCVSTVDVVVSSFGKKCWISLREMAA